MAFVITLQKKTKKNDRIENKKVSVKSTDLAKSK